MKEKLGPIEKFIHKAGRIEIYEMGDSKPGERQYGVEMEIELRRSIPKCRGYGTTIEAAAENALAHLLELRKEDRNGPNA